RTGRLCHAARAPEAAGPAGQIRAHSVGSAHAIRTLSRTRRAPLCFHLHRGGRRNVQGLDALLIERSPDFLVILDAELRVVKASAGLRSSVPLVAPGESFVRSLADPSQERLRQALTMHQDGTFSLSLELVHRGRERLISTAYRFYGVERPYIAGVGRESATSSELVDQVDVLRRRYHESV